MKKLTINPPRFTSLTAAPKELDPEQEVPLSVAIRSDYHPVQYRKQTANPQQYATDEGLKRERQQQHKAWLDKLREQPH